LSGAEIEAGQFIGGDGRRIALPEHVRRRLFAGDEVAVEGEVVRLDPSESPRDD
jgi:hypothetical protein